MIRRAAVTICSLNYVPKAKVLLETYLTFHPNDATFLLIVDRRSDDLSLGKLPTRVIWVDQLGIADFLPTAFCFDVIEMNTNVKPAVLLHLLCDFDQVVYLDPDICVYQPLVPVFEALATASVVVTPHSNTPVMDGAVPDDIGFLRFGAYNLGFVAVSKCEEARSFLSWWGQRCLAHGYYEPQAGLAVDQKWVDLAPAFFPNLKILHDPGLNLAFWNLHERTVAPGPHGHVVNGSHPLYFIHFSSFDERNPHVIANKQTRFPPGSRPDILPLAREYAARLVASAAAMKSVSDYGFDFFDDGVPITPTLRRAYAALKGDLFTDANPFAADSQVRKFAERKHLLNKHGGASKRVTFKDMGKFQRHEKAIFVVLRVALRVLGPDRYFALMRYLAHVSSIRNQKGVFNT